NTLKGKITLKVIIKDSKREYDRFFKVDRVLLQHEKFDGSMSKEIDRLNLNRGDTVAVILYNKTNKSVVLIRQFRLRFILLYLFISMKIV
ncbi:MAG: hypothetical protein NUV86_08300, partial [Candidatus Scalindua sp.]|nr:hypothetical protein [Candidatus Scalindua sp.]MCR4345376.1 hypothetical protein [Candidatus Scalindua sp.]